MGITVYRDGSKAAQVLEVGADPGRRTKTQRKTRERPKTIRGVTERMRTAHGNAYVTVNFDDDGLPFEVFTTVGKAGGADQAHLEAISRLASLALRSGIPAVEIVEQLRGITSEPVWDGGRLITSAPDAVAQALALHALEGGTEEEQRLRQAYAAQTALPMGAETLAYPRCPDCNGPVVRQEGCAACPACGWNRCA